MRIIGEEGSWTDRPQSIEITTKKLGGLVFWPTCT